MYLAQDHISLEAMLTDEDDMLAKCAVSHALALHIKLAVFEQASGVHLHLWGWYVDRPA